MRVLLVDDSAVYRKLIGDQLKSWGFDVTIAETGEAAWHVLKQPDSPKLVLLDWVLPDQDGTELCQRIRKADPTGSYVYVILLTSKEGRENMLNAMEAGVDDYLVKPFDESELKARLLVGKRILNLQDELVAARESMRHAATYDSLTGLLNRGEILEMLNRELERSRREQKPLAVIMADIDYFKKINDTFGHLFGDEALREIGKRLHANLRVYDGVGRYGGEEFLLVLPSCDLEGAIQRANELRQMISSTPVTSASTEKTISMSMGVAVSECTGAQEIEAMLNRADCALYVAKANGRNRVEHYDPARKETAEKPQK
jgi:two-component system cell cycle response regulator